MKRYTIHDQFGKLPVGRIKSAYHAALIAENRAETLGRPVVIRVDNEP